MQLDLRNFLNIALPGRDFLKDLVHSKQQALVPVYTKVGLDLAWVLDSDGEYNEALIHIATGVRVLNPV